MNLGFVYSGTHCTMNYTSLEWHYLLSYDHISSPHRQQGPSTKFWLLISFFCPPHKSHIKAFSVAPIVCLSAGYASAFPVGGQKKEIRNQKSVLGPFCRWDEDIYPTSLEYKE